MTTDKIEEKIRKLLQLAQNNPSVNEAAVAFARAQDLATAHGLEIDDVLARAAAAEAPPPPREVGPIVQEPIDQWDRTPAWRWTIGAAVARANGCKAYTNGGLWYYGQAQDIATARYVYLAIVREVEAMAKRAVATYAADPENDPRWDASPRVYGRSWRMGCADAIAARLPTPKAAIEKARAEVQEARALALSGAVGDPSEALAVPTNALVRVDQAAEYVAKVEAAVETHGKKVLKLRTCSGFAGASSHGGYAAGRTAGRGVSLGGSGRALKGGA